MSEYRDLFRGKRITMLGLGLLGRGVGDAEFLAQCGAELTVTDTKSAEELAGSVNRLRPYDIAFHLGPYQERDFREADMIIKAAGVPLDSPQIAAAEAAGVPVHMSTALFAREARAMNVRVIGVTGTRGKSTITYLINRTLAHASLRTHLGGNIRGVSTLALLPHLQAGDFAVLELDSWQLQGFGTLKISPQISIFSNLMKDHMNYYGAVQASDTDASRASVSEPNKPNERSEYEAMDAYFDDKANIFRYQKEGDVLIVGPGVLERVQAAHPPVAPATPAPLPSDWILRVPGEHNRENAALARAALLETGIFDDEIRIGLETFLGAEGRLQYVGEQRGIHIYNDNNATTPEATIAALRALRETYGHGVSIILIMGGADKGLDTTGLVEEMNTSAGHAVFLSGSGTTLFLRTAGSALKTPRSGPYNTLEEAVGRAREIAKKGDAILFSPAFASFGPPPSGFTNEYDRNDRFLALVK
jgi:UDP-N-acetylmuramoylalanine--D-glutamate ligase